MIIRLQEHYNTKYSLTRSNEAIWEETDIAINRLVTASDAYNRDCPNIPDASDSVPIFLIMAVYQAADLLLSLRPKDQGSNALKSLQSLHDLLCLIDMRWNLAGMLNSDFSLEKLVESVY